MKKIISYIMIHRLLLILFGFSVLTLIPIIRVEKLGGNGSFDMFQGNHIYKYTEPENTLINMWSIWDSKWYISIAEDGYSKQKYPFKDIDNKGFMPLYSILIFILSSFLFLNSHLAGIIISNILLISSFYFLNKLIKSDIRLTDKIDINDTYLYILFFPTSFFLSSIYPESLFLLLSILVFYTINIKRIYLTCIFIGLAFITKIYGIFLIIPLIIYILRNRNIINIYKLIKYIIILSIIPIIYLLYMLYISNDALAYMHIQKQFFDHAWINPIVTIYNSLLTNNFHNILNSVMTIFSISILILGIRVVDYSYILYGLIFTLFTPFTGMVTGNTRYLASLFILPIILSIIIKENNYKMLYIGIMSFIQGFIFIWWILGLIS